MKDQLLKLLTRYSLTATRFADEIGVQRSGISHILSGRNQPSFDFIVKICKRYPEISMEWLILGKEPMMRSDIHEKAPVKPDLFSSAESQRIEKRSVKSEPARTITTDENTLKVTNVTTIDQIVIFYTDGTCKPYSPAANG